MSWGPAPTLFLEHDIQCACARGEGIPDVPERVAVTNAAVHVVVGTKYLVGYPGVAAIRSLEAFNLNFLAYFLCSRRRHRGHIGLVLWDLATLKCAAGDAQRFEVGQHKLQTLAPGALLLVPGQPTAHDDGVLRTDAGDDFDGLHLGFVVHIAPVKLACPFWPHGLEG